MINMMAWIHYDKCNDDECVMTLIHNDECVITLIHNDECFMTLIHNDDSQ